MKPFLKISSLDPNNLANYRPISKLSFMSKILEKAALKQLVDHMQTNSLHDELQCRFRIHHSAEAALIKVTNNPHITSDSFLLSVLVLLNLSAAFETIEHNIVLYRL